MEYVFGTCVLIFMQINITLQSPFTYDQPPESVIISVSEETNPNGYFEIMTFATWALMESVFSIAIGKITQNTAMKLVCEKPRRH